MKNLLFVLSLMIAIQTNVYSQLQKDIENHPLKYVEPKVDVDDKIMESYKKTLSKDFRPWNAYCCNEGSYMYETGACKSQKMRLSFMDRFVIVGELYGGSVMEVVRFDRSKGVIEVRGSKKNISAVKNYTEEAHGFIKSEDLMLWQKSLKNENEILIKGLSISSQEMYENPGKYMNGGRLKVYKDLNQQYESSKSLGLFEFLYVYKYEGDQVLLGYIDVISSESSAKTEMLGWANVNNIFEWETRLCFQPSTDRGLNERRSKDIKATLMNSENGAINWSAGAVSNYDEGIVWNRDQFETMLELTPRWPRMPNLYSLEELRDNKDKNVIKSAVVMDLIDENGNMIMSPADERRLSMQIAEMDERKRTINVVFVIDGTGSMEPYFTPIANSIKELIDENDRSVDLQFGCVIYWDESEKDCKTKNIDLTKSKNLSDGESIKRFLEDKIRNKDTELGDCNDKDTYEGLFYGLKEGVGMFKNGKETNLLVLIGDAGHDPSKPNYQSLKRDVTSELIRKNVNVMSFQVNNNSGSSTPQAYLQYQLQSKEIIEATAAGIDRSSVKMTNASDKENTRILDYPENSPIIGLLHFQPSGSKMATNTLQVDIESSIIVLKGMIDKNLDEAKSALMGRSSSSSMGLAVKNYLESIDPTLREQLLNSDKEIFRFMVEGYIARSHKDLNAPVYDQMIFLSNRELFDVEASLNSVLDPSLPFSQQRDYMANAFVEVMKSHIDTRRPRRGDDELDKILATVFGALPSEVWEGIRIDDIKDPKKVDDNRLQQMIVAIENSLADIRAIKQAEDEYRFKVKASEFWWLPVTALP